MKLSRDTKVKVLKVVQLVEGKGQSVRAACKAVGIGKTTYYRLIRKSEEDARDMAIQDKADVEAEAKRTLDTLNERSTDLQILNNLLGRLLKGIQEGKWTPDQVEERLLRIVDAKGHVLSGVERGRRLVESLTLVDARSITFENVPEDIRAALYRELCEKIWDSVCPACKEALSA